MGRRIRFIGRAAFCTMLVFYTCLFKGYAQKMWGMLQSGGANNGGVIFSYDPSTSTYKDEYDLPANSNPSGTVTQAGNGKFYGMTSTTLFEYDPVATTYKSLANAGANVGSGGDVIQSPTNGKLYGMTYYGGSANQGQLFEYDLSTSTFSTKVNFLGASNGANPSGSLIQASNGKIYGMTTGGGSSNYGTLFEYDLQTGILTKKFDFGGNFGVYPFGSLVEVNGRLYGTCRAGGASGFGTLFFFNIALGQVSKVFDFTSSGAHLPSGGSLVAASNNKLYGITLGGGNGFGSIYEYDPGFNATTTKLSPGNTSPYVEVNLGSLCRSSTGILYGIGKGGTSSYLFGNLFSYDVSSNTISVVYTLSGGGGSSAQNQANNQGMNLEKLTQTITFASINTPVVYGSASIALSASSSQGQPITYISSNPSVATITNGSTLNFVGAGTVTITAAAAGNATYLPGFSSQTITVSKIALSVTGITTADKTYDGTANASINGTATLQGTIIAGDNVTLSTAGATASFADKKAGNSKTVTFSGYALSGTSAANYTLSQPSSLTANISTIPLTVTGVTASGKTYDGTVNAPISGTAALSNGVVNGDKVNLSGGAATFADKFVANGKTITFSGYSISGADASNYTLNQPASVTGNITKKALAVSGVSVNSKTYDGTANATITGVASLSGVINGDNVVLSTGSATAQFIDKYVGNSKTVSYSGYSISGSDVSNYTLTQPSATYANITAKTISISWPGPFDKVYDGTVNANIAGATLSGVIANDVVVVDYQNAYGRFLSKYVANGQQVTLGGFALAGTDQGNYVLTPPALTTANITPKALNVLGVGASGKTYDGTVNAPIFGNAVLSGVVNGDAVTLGIGNAQAQFADKFVANNKSVTFTGYSISGTDAWNYTISQPSGITANITPKTLIITGVAANGKTYDGTANATITGVATLSGVVNGDNVLLSTPVATAQFVDKNAGSNKLVSFSGYSISGTDAQNYTLTQPSFTANILAKAASVSGMGPFDKVYDGTVTANIAGAALSGAIQNDNVTLSTANAFGQFSSKVIGSNKQITFGGFSLSGADAGNYTLSQPANATGNITAKSLTITGVMVNGKTYDGTTNATFAGGSVPALNGVVTGDNVILSTANATAQFNDKLIGNGKPVTVNGFAINGTDASNYTLTQPTGFSSIIIAKNLTVNLTVADKQYDGTTTASFTGTPTLVGAVPNDQVALTIGTASFATKGAGQNKPVIYNGFSITGADVNNYTLTQPTATANITKIPVTISNVSASSKNYDGTTAAQITGNASLNGILAAEVGNITLGGTPTATFSDPNAGIKTVTFSGYALVGTGGVGTDNYTLNQPASVQASINKIQLILKADDQTRPYNSPDPVFTGSFVAGGFVNNETASVVSGNATFTTTANAASPVNNSPYAIHPNVSAMTATNYQIISADGNLTITQAPQTIMMPPLFDKNVSDPPFVIQAAADSGNPVSFTVAATNNAATFNSATNTITLTGQLGMVTVTASQAGDANYNAAADVVHTFQVNNNPAATINVTDFSVTSGGNSFVPATSNSSGSLVYVIIPGGTGNATVDQQTGMITPISPGTVNVRVYVNGDATHNGTYKDVVMTIKLPQVIPALSLNTSYVYGTANITLPATTDGNLTIAYTTTNDPVAKIVNGNQVQFTGVGSAIISANQAGDNNYSAATQVTATVQVTAASQTISGFNAFGTVYANAQPITLSATASSGLAVQYSSSNASVATVNGATLTIVGAGTATITASQPGNSNYNPAPSLTQTLVVDSKVIALTGALQYGNTTIGLDHPVKSFTIANSGTKDLAVSSITLPAGYTADQSTATIHAGQSLTVNVTFVPTAAQDYNGNITVTSDATSGSNTIAVTGKGQLIAGLGDDNVQEAVSAYPNPSNGVFVITVNDGDGTGILTDASGKAVAVQLTTTSKKNHYQLDISDKDAGVYLLQCASGKAKVVIRLVKF